MLVGNVWRADALYVVERGDLDGIDLPAGLEVNDVTAERLAELTKTDEHQGLAARMPGYPYEEFAEFLAREPDRVLVLDRIQYPMNFGTMLRSAEVFGVTDVLVARSGQSDVTASVARMSAGAVFHTRICEVDDLAAAVRSLGESGVRVFATTPEQGLPCDEVDLTGRVGLVIGRESDGVSASVLDACDGRVLIPQTGQTQSLNAAASAAIVLYELSRQQRTAAV